MSGARSKRWWLIPLVCAIASVKKINIIVLVLLTVSTAGFGQSDHASIIGTVTDQSNAVVPGVRVTAVNEATKLAVRTTTASIGTYNLLNLPFGPHKLVFAKVDVAGNIFS